MFLCDCAQVVAGALRSEPPPCAALLMFVMSPATVVSSANLPVKEGAQHTALEDVGAQDD